MRQDIKIHLQERDEISLENIEDLWNSALEEIEKKISKPSFDTWLRDTKAEQLREDILTVNVPNEFARDWLEGRYTQIIADILVELIGAQLTTTCIIPESAAAIEERKQAPKQRAKNNPNYTAHGTMV